MTPTGFPVTPRPVSALVMFCLIAYGALCAVSVIWLSDWGRNGPAFAAGYGAAQRQAVGVALVCGAGLWWLRDRLLHALLRCLAARSGQSPARRWGGLLALLLGAVLAIGALHWAHKLQDLPGLPGALQPFAAAASRWAVAQGGLPVRAALTVELLRLPACLLLAWCLYRWQHAGLPWVGNLLLALAVALALGLGLWVSQDKGPMLVIAIAAVFLCAGTAASLLATLPRGRWLALAVGLGLTTAAMAGLLLALPHLAPADRVAAWRQPYANALEYLAQITWFVQAAGLGGFGLGHTPWCGYAGAVVGRCLGMPTETQSDYTLAALAGLWGPLAALALVALCALWLLSLLRLAALAPRPQHGIDAAGLAASAGALYALMLLAQLVVTSLGNVGVLPLTGVTLPLLSWGRASLLGATLAMAMVLPGRHAGRGHKGAAGPWSAVSTLAALGALVGLGCTAWGFAQRLQDTAPAQLAKGRANPWLPLPGCVRSAEGLPLSGLPLLPGLQAAVCQPGDNTTLVAAPPDDPALRQALVRLAAQQPVAAPVVQKGLAIARRADLPTTLDAALQARSNQIVDCLAGAGTACDGLLAWPLRQRYAQRFEGAAVRSVSSVTLRLRDGALLASAHARSACSLAQMQNTQRPPHCPPEAARALARPGRQSQQALHAHDMVASTVKPWLADGVLSAPGGQRWLIGAAREQLLQALALSDTAFFIDQLLCFDRIGDPSTCSGPAVLAQRAQALGLAAPINLLARAADPQAAPRLLLPGLPLDLPPWPPTGQGAEAELAAARRCHDRPANQRWRACEGPQLAALVAPLWGQGVARSHPLAVAHLYLKLAAAARGQAQVKSPHLLADGGALGPVGFRRADAELILEGLRRTPLVGTARSACASVRGPLGCTGLGLAMKTGTSLFPHDGMTMAQRAAHCQAVFRAEDAARANANANADADASASASASASARPLPPGLARDALHCALYPMKWAVLIEPEQPGGADALLTVVLVERNAQQADGRLDAADDRGPNAAAEAALLLHAQRLNRPLNKPLR